jgi:hypothetical protein
LLWSHICILGHRIACYMIGLFSYVIIITGRQSIVRRRILRRRRLSFRHPSRHRPRRLYGEFYMPVSFRAQLAKCYYELCGCSAYDGWNCLNGLRSLLLILYL